MLHFVALTMTKKKGKDKKRKKEILKQVLTYSKEKIAG